MFKRKTVFVVGAGGSKEIGLPTGDELRVKIANALSSSVNGFNRTELAGALVEIYNLRSENLNIDRYLKAAKSISRAMFGALSIDNFLATHRADEDIILMGKLAIASVILEEEGKSAIKIDSNGEILFQNTETYWMNTFCKLMSEEVVRGDFATLFHDVSIITFNYDRCIEHFLPHYLETYFLIDKVQAHKLASTLNVIHPYGRVGGYPSRSGSAPTIPFGSHKNRQHLAVAANQVQTFGEKLVDDVTVKRMKQLINEAEHIVFLGFSFADMNMELLVPEVVYGRKTIFATTLGMSDPNLHPIKLKMISDFRTLDTNAAPDVHMVDMSANDLLNKYWRPIFK
ncbi:SIR2 family protein [Rhizobium leguminosarum]|uniref:SIR2 family protein n=1 Tax=Rhizobium leguminosarum TaxID=384 RepID=UPI0013EF3F27|nr:SIR2 family protein [Rhizobium leguminosarum]